MAFPIGWPDFTKEQRRRLTELAVLGEQADELRHLLFGVMHTPKSARRAPLADVRRALTGVRTHAGELAQLLDEVATHSSAAMAEALALLDTKHGAKGLRSLASDLTALADAAQKGIGKRGERPTRHPSSMVNVVAAIDAALTKGWQRANGQPKVRRSVNPAEVARVKFAKRVPHMRQYQQNLWPSESEASAFSEIVGIFFGAAGAGKGQKLAIRNFLKQSREQHAKLAAVLWPDLASKLKGTSRKR